MKLILSILLCSPFLAFTQEITLSGQISNKNKKPIQYANIFIEGTYEGASTDSLGYFKFTTTKGLKTIKITALSYQSQIKQIEINNNKTLNITLEPNNTSIDEVVVQAGSFRVGNLSKSILSPLDIVTTAGSNGNIVAALDKLPGAQIAGENGRLMVRGGDPHETQTYINGIRVSQPYTNTNNGVPARGRFSPYLFTGTNFSTGAYSAEYGNALSSILNLTTALDMDQPKTNISISSIGLGASNANSWKKISLTTNLDYSNLKPYSKLIPQKINWTKPYEQLSGEAILKSKGENYFFNLYTSYAAEKMGINNFDIDYMQNINANISSNNVYINSTYIHYLPQNWKLETGASYGYENKSTLYHVHAIPNTNYHLHAKSKVTKRLNSSTQYSFGGEYFYDDLQEKLTSSNSPTQSYGYTQRNAAIFATNNLKYWNKLHVEAGIRYSTDFNQNKNIDPRLSLTYQMNNKNVFAFAYGTFHQNANEDILKHQNNLHWSKASHYILNYNYTTTGRFLRIELFNKNYGNLAQFDTPSPTLKSTFNSNGYGKAQGIDIFWKDNKTIHNLQYWISYSFADVNKKEKNYPTVAQPDYVSKHYASIVGKYWIRKLHSQIGITNSFSSGRPYNNPNQQKFMSSRTTYRNNLAVNWSYLLTQQKIIHLSISNVLGQTPIFGYKYNQSLNKIGQFDRQPILPTAKRFIFVGFFWTISRNKTDNNLINL